MPNDYAAALRWAEALTPEAIPSTLARGVRIADRALFLRSLTAGLSRRQPAAMTRCNDLRRSMGRPEYSND